MESRLEFELVQQSPMIHFQYDEEGAALRATDVKPRLDRFLIEEYKKEKPGENVPENWVQPGQPEALKYRMRIAAPEGNPSVNVPTKGLYFGNIGDRNRKKMMIFYNNPLRLEIICFVKELRDYIEEKIRLFFCLNNFGTRQGKGFGSFIVKGSKEGAERLLAKYYGQKTIYRMTYQQGTTAENILLDVNEVYKILKSGINFNNVYIKSYLTVYFLEKGIEGEKRWMKTVGIAPIVVTKGEMSAGSVKKPKYIRALLGTGEVQSWLAANNYNKPYKVYKRGRWVNEREDIKITSKEIARMPSPIVFKIIENTLYIFPNEPQKEIYGKEFTFSGKRSSNLYVPDSVKDQFSMAELMDGFKGYFNTEKSKYNNVPNRNHGDPDAGKPFFIRQEIQLEEVDKIEEVQS